MGWWLRYFSQSGSQASPYRLFWRFGVPFPATLPRLLQLRTDLPQRAYAHEVVGGHLTFDGRLWRPRAVPSEVTSANILTRRWLLLRPELTDRDLSTCVLVEGGKGLAITRDGWESFLCWLLETLRAKLDDMEQAQ